MALFEETLRRFKEHFTKRRILLWGLNTILAHNRAQRRLHFAVGR